MSASIGKMTDALTATYGPPGEIVFIVDNPIQSEPSIHDRNFNGESWTSVYVKLCNIWETCTLDGSISMVSTDAPMKFPRHIFVKPDRYASPPRYKEFFEEMTGWSFDGTYRPSQSSMASSLTSYEDLL